MDFGFDDEQLALRDATRAFCRHHLDLSSVASRETAPADPELWSGLADIGALGMLIPTDSFAGGVIEAAIACEQLGEHLSVGPVLWSMIAAPFVPEVGTGTIRATGIDLAQPSAPFVVDHTDECDVVLVVDSEGIRSCAASALKDPLDGTPFDPLTPSLAFAELPRGAPIGGADDARRLRLCGTVLAAAQLVGVAQGALDCASAYALERHQFGVPIGSFQAIKHLLADMYARVALARSATYAAAAMVDDERDGNATAAASAAKLLAGEAGLGNGRAAVQILGGMGFTWEMLPHYFLKRAWVLENTFGTGETHALRLSDALEAVVRNPAATWT